MVGLAGKTAMVVGASRGIGLAIASALAAEGANVVLTARSAEAARVAAATVSKRAVGVGVHALDESGAIACVTDAVRHFGSLDLLINNVGTNPAFGPLVEIDRDQFLKTLEVNLWPPLLWTRLAWQAWMREHGGSIVNTASLSALITGGGLGTYGASKAALIHLTEQLARELGPQVRVNALAPGIVRTRLSELTWRTQETGLSSSLPLGRIGEPADIAQVAVFLATDAASWITGETIVVDGGHRISAHGPETATSGFANPAESEARR